MESKIILFDGVCNLCNGAINFIIKRNSKATLKFASLQSDTGKQLLKEYNIDSLKTDSIVLIDSNKAFLKSDAALHIAKDLDDAYPLFYSFMIIPAFIRNSIYDLIARNRYKWFGKKESCMIPTPDLKSRFLD